MEKNSKIRAQRRLDTARMKKRAKEIYPDQQPGKLADHLAECSCHMCGNPRKHWGEVTISEKRQSLRFDDYIQEQQAPKSPL